jgi:hypothetical protein
MIRIQHKGEWATLRWHAVAIPFLKTPSRILPEIPIYAAELSRNTIPRIRGAIHALLIPLADDWSSGAGVLLPATRSTCDGMLAAVRLAIQHKALTEAVARVARREISMLQESEMYARHSHS